MTNKIEYKAGDEVVLNCTEREFSKGVGCGSTILKENFINGVAVVKHAQGINVTLREGIVGKGAAALSERELKYIKHKPIPQTRTTYEKVTFSKLSEVFAEHEKAPLYCDDSDMFWELDTNNVYTNFIRGLPLYIKVETPITPMEISKDACRKAVKSSDKVYMKSSMADFVSVDKNKDEEEFDVEFLNICRAIVNAYDGVEGL